jgi:hypothetical protein
LSLVEAVERRRLVESYGPLPRAEDFARLRNPAFSEQERDSRDPATLAVYRKRWLAKLTTVDRLRAAQRRYEAKK